MRQRDLANPAVRLAFDARRLYDVGENGRRSPLSSEHSCKVPHPRLTESLFEFHMSLDGQRTARRLLPAEPAKDAGHQLPLRIDEVVGPPSLDVSEEVVQHRHQRYGAGLAGHGRGEALHSLASPAHRLT